MSVRKIRAKIRGKPAEETEYPVAASALGGQTKVVEYFPTICRDPAKKSKHLKVFVEKDELKDAEHNLESPKKMARLKPCRTPEKSAQSDSREWILPITSKTETALKSDMKESTDNGKDKCSLEVTKNNTLSPCATKRIELENIRKSMCEETKHGAVKAAFVEPCETETSKEGSVDLSILPSAVKLVESIKNNVGSVSVDKLPLPSKYELLLRLFEYTEVVVSWLERQGKRITLDEVMANVQRELKSNCNEQKFAMILAVYPESYNIRCERRWKPFGDRHRSLKEFEYVLEPNFIDDLILPMDKNMRKTLSGAVNSGPVSPCKLRLISIASSSAETVLKSPSKSPNSNAITRCPSKLESRRLHRKLEFRSRLRKLVNMQHAAFLKNEGIEISSDEQLLSYHPDFDLDAVADIIPAELPEMPKGDAGQPETMREFLKAIPDSSSTLPEKLIIKEPRSPEKKDAVVADKCISLSPKKYVETKKISTSSLLERIRAKERERKQREMMRNPEVEQRKGRLERISHSYLQCIRSYYNLKRVGSMKFVDLVDKLAFSIGVFSKVEVEAAIILLCDVCPTYFKMVEVRGEKYVQLRNNDFSAIRNILNEEIKKCV